MAPGEAIYDRFVMRYQTFVAVIVTSCVLAGQAGAQVAVPVPRKGSWQIVENLPRGTLLSVKSALTDGSTQTVKCVFHSADDAQLECGHWTRPRPFVVYPPRSEDEYVFPREQVLQVRIENEDAQTSASTMAGALAGATLGGIVGYNCCGATGGARSAGAVGLGLLGAVVLGTVGHVFPFVKGKVIYEQ